MQVALTVNGAAHTIDVEPRRTLADALRDDCGLTGTHLGCEQGVCGACTVLRDGEPVRSCLIFAVQCDGDLIRTVEGIAGGGALTPLQAAFSAEHGLQCGYCTPGFLMLATWMTERDRRWSAAQVRDVLASNVCRCTGYAGIVAAVTSVLAAEGKYDA